MKKFIFLAILVLATPVLYAQQENQKLFVLLEFMQVPDDKNSDYWEVEEFWSKIHQQRVADGNIIGWDLWMLTPGGSQQGSQFMTATLFSTLEGMLEGVPDNKFGEYVEKAHPDLSDDQRNKMFEETVTSRDLAHQVFCSFITGVGTTEQLKVGTIMTMDAMKQVDPAYVQMEQEIFKPWHQQIVDNGEKLHWGFMHIIYPKGEESYATHITYSMYENYGQLAQSIQNWDGEIDVKTQVAAQAGIKTRIWKEQKICRLVMKVR